jgi:hypothetical protein
MDKMQVLFRKKKRRDVRRRTRPLQLFATPVFRLWQNHHPSAFFWSKKGIYRFDSKSARYGVLYTGSTLEGATLEVFGDQWVKRRVLSRMLLKKYRVSVMLPARRLSLVDTTGSKSEHRPDSLFYPARASELECHLVRG